jgi:hypothetical protein
MMSSEVKRRSPAEWFLESFFQERNIKWMLALGVMIVFGSSLMLVTTSRVLRFDVVAADPDGDVRVGSSGSTR